MSRVGRNSGKEERVRERRISVDRKGSGKGRRDRYVKWCGKGERVSMEGEVGREEEVEVEGRVGEVGRGKG